MKKLLLLISILFLFGFTGLKAGDNPPLSLSGTYLVGSSQPVYKTLTDVAHALNTIPVEGNVIFELDNDYDGMTGETFPVIFNEFSPVGGSWTVTIRPKAGVTMRTTAGDPGPGQALITLNGTDHIIFDGRAGGNGGIAWLLRNTNTTANAGATLFLQNDAQNNVLTYLQVEGQSVSDNTGTICVGSTTGPAGNDNNTVSYCRIRDRSDVTGIPTTGILLKGSTASPTAFNSGNSITHNEIFNVYHLGDTSFHISMRQGTTATSVTYNSIYQATAIENTTTATSLFGIFLSELQASDMTVSNNFIGGSAPECGGEPFTITSTAGHYANFSGIIFATNNAATTGHTISNNTIKNLDLTIDKSPSSSYAAFIGILVAGGTVNVSTNTIGNTEGHDAIRITANNGANVISGSYGIFFISREGGSISGNKIGGITMGGTLVTTASNGSVFSAIHAVFTPTAALNFPITGNMIGSTTISDNIRFTSAVTARSFFGLYTNIGTPASLAISNNTVAGVSLGYSGTSVATVITPIRLMGAAPAVVSNNLVSDISSASLTANSGLTFQGIWSSAATSAMISNNTLRHMRLTGTALMNGTSANNSIIFGISVTGTGTTAEVYNNKLYDFTSANNLGPSSETELMGIDVRVNAKVYNNLISLDNGSNTNNCEIRGIRILGTAITVNVLHNTIYIGGNNGNTSQAADSWTIGRLASSGQAAYYLRNNLLVNARTGGNGSHYIFYNPVSTPATGWPATASDYNMLVSGNNKFGAWNTSDLDSTQWKTTSGGDAHSSFYTTSQLAPSALFVDSASDPDIKPGAWDYVRAKGVGGTGVTTDQLGKTRNTTNPDVGAYEYPVEALRNLAMSEGVLSPAFDRKITSYTDSVSNTITGIRVIPTILDVSAVIVVNGVPAASGTPSGNIPLDVGANTITVETTAGGITDTYTITVIRKALSDDANLLNLSLSTGTLAPVFNAATLSYTASVADTISSITLTPTANDAGVTITVNGDPVISGNVSGPVPLNTGANTITVIVTAENGTTVKNYTVQVTRISLSSDANLSALSLSTATLAPLFDAATLSYTAMVANTVGSITVTPSTADAGAAVTVNSIAVTSGNASGEVSLNEGSNTITIIVTAENGTTVKTYTITITRDAAVNNAPVITSYGGNAAVTLQVPENTTVVTTVTATDADAGTTLVYSLAGGEDAAKFNVNSATGVLSFLTLPDFEQPGDANGDNAYIVAVQVSDGDTAVIQRFKFKITDANDHAPVITSYNGNAGVSLQVPENTTTVIGTVKAADVDKNTTIIYSLVDEEDAAKFTVNSATGELSFLPAPDFEQPGDSNGDNVYMLTVKASDGDSSTTQRFKIRVTNLNDNTPVFTSHSGQATVNLELPENTQSVTTATAADGDGTAVIYSILDEDDGARFSVNSSGQLSFITAPDFEHPADGNRDNIYVVTVKASDGSLWSVQRFEIKITDLNDNLPVVTMTVRVPENTVEVTDLEASDADAGSHFTIDILDQEDGALFWMNPANGWLEFRSAPNYEQPADADHDNTYLVLIKITDGDFSFILRVKVKVTDMNETARSSNPAAKGGDMPAPEKAIAKEQTETVRGIQAYPNPVTGKRFTLRMDSVATGRYSMEIYTTAGQLVYRQQLDHTGRTASYPICLPAQLTKGLYVLKLTGGHTRFSQKLLIE